MGDPHLAPTLWHPKLQQPMLIAEFEFANFAKVGVITLEVLMETIQFHQTLKAEDIFVELKTMFLEKHPRDPMKPPQSKTAMLQLNDVDG